MLFKIKIHITSLLLLCYFLTITPANPTKKLCKSCITKTELIAYVKSFLINNLDTLACQTNESGFLRINIPVTEKLLPSDSAIKKLRLNYWSLQTGILIADESIHNHPYYFESLIISGGYTHEIYALQNNSLERYNLYQILKIGTKKNFAFIGEAGLSHVATEKVSTGDFKKFSCDLIHKIKTTEPETVSINTVFEDASKEFSSYNLFLTKSGTLADIKTSKTMLSNMKSRHFIEKIIKKLETT